MGSYKLRQNNLVPGSITLGVNGTKASQLFFGSATACYPAIGPSSIGTGSMAIANLPATAIVMVMPAFVGASGISVIAASAIAGGASLSFLAPGPSIAASTATFTYIAFA